MKKLHLIICICGLMLFGTNVATASFSDDFEDGVIDANLWVIGGEKWGWQIHPPGDGSWTYSHEEIIDSDGYLRMRVEGPTSGNTYGADAWVRTVYDFNDGNSHLINFRWEADVNILGHYDYYFIQITDGYIPGMADVHWPIRRPPLPPITESDLSGTVDLLWHEDIYGNPVRGWALEEGMDPNSMSIKITPDGIARLYSESNATGGLLHVGILDSNKPWYIRFMVSDATSAGFSAGDDRLNLYDFSAKIFRCIHSYAGDLNGDCYVDFRDLAILAKDWLKEGRVPTYRLDCIMPAPHCTSVDLSPNGTKLCARMQYGSWDEGYRVFDANTTDICTYTVLNDCNGYWAPWQGLVSSDSAYLWTTLYYRGDVAKINLNTCEEPNSVHVGSWPVGLAFDSQRRYLYVGENCPGGAGAIGSLKVVDTNTAELVGSATLNGQPGKCIVVDPCDEFVYLVSHKPDINETLYKIRTSDYGVEGTLALPGVDEPGISVSPDGSIVYVPYPDANSVYAIGAATLSIMDTLSIDSPDGFFVSPDGTHALVTGRLSPDIRIFDLLMETVVQTIYVGDIGTYGRHLTSPYWDMRNGKVYVNLPATEGGAAVLSWEW